jgi:hypothetical protein
LLGSGSNHSSQNTPFRWDICACSTQSQRFKCQVCHRPINKVQQCLLAQVEQSCHLSSFEASCCTERRMSRSHALIHGDAVPRSGADATRQLRSRAAGALSRRRARGSHRHHRALERRCVEYNRTTKVGGAPRTVPIVHISAQLEPFVLLRPFNRPTCPPKGAS